MNDSVEPLNSENEKLTNAKLDEYIKASENFSKLYEEPRNASEHFSKIYEDAKEKEANDFWDSLSYDDKCNAFHAVVSRIFDGDIKQRGSYRYVLYDVFKFSPDMYTRGMDCGYMALHNAIFDGEELVEMRSVNRFEVIDENGRSYTKYLKDNEGIKYSLQDDKKTLKVFIDTESWKSGL